MADEDEVRTGWTTFDEESVNKALTDIRLDDLNKVDEEGSKNAKGMFLFSTAKLYL